MSTESLFSEFDRTAMFGTLTQVKEFLQKSPELLNASDNYGFTVLHNLMSEEQFDTLTYLTAQGAEVDAQNDQGIAPLHLACYPENARILLEAGANINLQDHQGNTPLHILAAEGRESREVIRYLIQAGADRSLRNQAGKLPVDIAQAREDWGNVQLLKG